ncbi:unnamed protein product [Brachionus calyciflorus]|uniref:DNA-directed RNA polymerase III subunit RPC5 n=1 Tax=Brachionus calyciflorus TaxID=104777 RepID=A0A813SXK7_9BILA|nr:unnamed protein product [Brachionus calyciflorus]
MSDQESLNIKKELIDHYNNSTNSIEKEKVEEEDPIVQEIDVYLSKSLDNKIYILQYPIRPQDRTYLNSKFLTAKLKPKLNKAEIEVELDTTNDNYSKVKGEQYALNVDGKQTVQTGKLNPKQKQPEQQQQQRYYKSNVMDKQVLTSTNATLGQMNRLYHLGLLKDDKLHLTPIQAILQMKPSFDYFDLVEKKTKELKESKDEPEYETEEEMENELEKAELVTMKYSNTTVKTTQEPEQNWINLNYLNQENDESKKLKENLFCKKQDQIIKLNISNEEFISRLVDINLKIESA